MSFVQVGALFVALGSSMQTIRWLTGEAKRLQLRSASAGTRVERLDVHRDLKQVRLDYGAWSLVAVGSWCAFLGSF